MGEAGLGEKVRLLAYVSVLITLVLAPHHHHHHHGYPAWWVQQAECIHEHESAVGYPYLLAWRKLGWHNKTNPSSRGGFQFLYSTWATVVKRHHLKHYPYDPADASRGQQILAAWDLYHDSGMSWGQWSTHAICGIA